MAAFHLLKTAFLVLSLSALSVDDAAAGAAWATLSVCISRSANIEKNIFVFGNRKHGDSNPPTPTPPLLYYCNLWERVCVVQWGMLTVLKEQVNFVLIATQEGKNKLLSFSPERVETIFQYDCCYFYCYF